LLNIYSHCLTPGTSEINKKNEHADIFISRITPLWVLGVHSFSGFGIGVCSPATPLSIVSPRGNLSVFTSSGSHYEIGFVASSDNYINIAREDSGVVNNVKGDPYLISNNLFNDRKFEIHPDNNDFFQINFKRKVKAKFISLNYRANGKVTLSVVVNGRSIKDIETDYGLETKYIKLENIEDTSQVTLKARSHGVKTELFMRPILIWEKK